MKAFFIIIFLLLFPLSVQADVRINELAWMGTDTSANDEWIELYNNGTEDINLEGWTLKAVDETPTVSISGTISAGGFFVLERSDDDTLPDVTADLIYTGALSNSGESLKLIDAEGATKDEININDGWPAGDNTTKDTMQWSGSSWITARPTPGKENTKVATPLQEDTPKKESKKNSSSSSSGVYNTKGELTTIPSVYVSPLPLSEVGEIRDFLVSAGTVRVVTTEQEVPFYGFIFDEVGTKIRGGQFWWSFGDGGSAYGEEVSHSYYHPGTYVVALNATFYSEEAVAQTEVLVVEPDIEITDIGIKNDKTFIRVHNKSSHDLNLNNWQLEGDSIKPFIFPKDTIIKAGQSVIFPEEITGVLTRTSAKLYNQNKTLIAFYEPKEDTEEQIIEPRVVKNKESIKTPEPKKFTPQKVPQVEVETSKEEVTIATQTALVLDSFTVEKQEGPIKKIIMIPVRLIRGIGNLF